MRLIHFFTSKTNFRHSGTTPNNLSGQDSSCLTIELRLRAYGGSLTVSAKNEFQALNRGIKWAGVQGTFPSTWMLMSTTSRIEHTHRYR